MDAEAYGRNSCPCRNAWMRNSAEIEKEVKKLAKPLLNIHCIREEGCEYPVAIKVTMDDGTVQTYGLENRTDYLFDKVMESVTKVTVGYRYKPPKRKNRIHRVQL